MHEHPLDVSCPVFIQHLAHLLGNDLPRDPTNRSRIYRAIQQQKNLT